MDAFEWRMNSMASLGILFLGCGSALYAVSGLMLLVRTRRLARAFVYVVVLVGYPLILGNLTVRSFHWLLWVGVPLVLGMPAWLLAGYVIRLDARGELAARPYASRRELQQDRMRGLCLVGIGGGIWCIGAIREGRPRFVEVALLGAACYALLFGVQRLIRALNAPIADVRLRLPER